MVRPSLAQVKVACRVLHWSDGVLPLFVEEPLVWNREAVESVAARVGERFAVGQREKELNIRYKALQELVEAARREMDSVAVLSERRHIAESMLEWTLNKMIENLQVRRSMVGAIGSPRVLSESQHAERERLGEERGFLDAKRGDLRRELEGLPSYGALAVRLEACQVVSRWVQPLIEKVGRQAAELRTMREGFEE